MGESSREQPDVPRPLRILEIGDELLFKSAVPEQTDFFWTGYKPRGKIAIALGPAAFFRAVRRLRRDEYDLLALHVPLYAPWHPRVILTVLRDWRLSAPRGLFAVFGWWLIQRFHRVPMVAIDLNDSFGINRHAFRLIDASRAYFKRELPADRWQVFFKSGREPAGLPLAEKAQEPTSPRQVAPAQLWLAQPVGAGGVEGEDGRRVLRRGGGEQQHCAQRWDRGAADAARRRVCH